MGMRVASGPLVAWVVIAARLQSQLEATLSAKFRKLNASRAFNDTRGKAVIGLDGTVAVS